MLKLPRAEDIAEDLLYRTGLAIDDGHFTAFGACFALPCVVETEHGLKIITKMRGIKETFQNVRNYYHENGVTTVARDVVEAQFLTHDTIGSTHVTSLLTKDGTVFRKPFPTYSVLRRGADAKWRIISCTYAILDSPRHNQALLKTARKDQSTVGPTEF